MGQSALIFWLKQEGEDLPSEFDVRPSYGEVPYQGEVGFGKVNDYEHVRIIKCRVTMKGSTGESLGYGKIGKKIGRSAKTIFKHCKDHNNMIHAVGECDRCARVGSKYATELID